MLGRSNSTSAAPPKKPKIAKIPLPDPDSSGASSSSSRPSLSPRTTTKMMTPRPAPPLEIITPKPRHARAFFGEQSLAGYYSEPEAKPPKPSPRTSVHVTLGGLPYIPPHRAFDHYSILVFSSLVIHLVPMKQGDGPSRPVREASGLDSFERSASRSGVPSGRTPKPQSAFIPPPLNETSRTYSRTTDTKPPTATPLVRPSAMKKKPSEKPSTPTAKKDILSPNPVRSRTLSYSCAMPTPKAVNFVDPPVVEIPNIHWQLLPFDRFKSKQCLHFDVSLPPETITACGRTIKAAQLEKSAAATKLTEMIIQGDLRWKIVLKRSKGITCEDVFQAIYNAYDVPLTEKDCANYDPKLLQRCEKAFQKRCEAVPRLSEREKRIGMKRVDLLNHRTYFHGLTKADADSPWKLELRATPPCGRLPS